MTNLFRHLLFLIIFLGILSIERVLGLPFVSLIVASNYLASTERISKTVGILFAGIFIAAAYFIPLWVGILIIAAIVFVLENRLIFFHRETLTYFFSVILGVIILGIASQYPVSPSTVMYHFVLAAICLLAIRSWLMRKSDKWKIL